MCKLCISPWNFNTKFFPTYPWYNVHIMARARYLHSELSGHEKCRITAQVTEVLVWNLAPDYTHRAQLFYSRTRHNVLEGNLKKFLTNWSNVLTQAHCESSTQEEVAHCESRGMSIKKDNTIVERNLTTFFIKNWMKKNAISKCMFIVQVIRVYFTTIPFCWTITSINAFAWS